MVSLTPFPFLAIFMGMRKPPIDEPPEMTEQDILCKQLDALVNKCGRWHNLPAFMIMFGLLAGFSFLFFSTITMDTIAHDKPIGLAVFTGIIFLVFLTCTIATYIVFRNADSPSVLKIKILNLAAKITDKDLQNHYITYAKFIVL